MSIHSRNKNEEKTNHLRLTIIIKCVNGTGKGKSGGWEYKKRKNLYLTIIIIFNALN